jgi:transcriptional regulator with XRE-family HTH domain
MNMASRNNESAPFKQCLLLEMERADVGVNELARRSGLSQAAISFLTNGKRDNPQRDTLIKLADGLGCHVSALF